MQIYINLKSGNPVTIVPGSEDNMKWTKEMKAVPCVTVSRIDCNKQLMTPVSNLQKLEDFIKDGGELCNSHLRIIEHINKGI